jgi:hypothetical protein
MVEGVVERRREVGKGEGAKKRIRSKSVRRAVTLSPFQVCHTENPSKYRTDNLQVLHFQERLKDTDCYTRPHLDAIAACSSVKVFERNTEPDFMINLKA